MSEPDPRAGHRAAPAAGRFGRPLFAAVLVLLVPADYLYEVWSATLVHCGDSGPSAAFGMCARDESEALWATLLVAGVPALGAVAGSLRARHHRARAAAFGALWAGLISLAVVLAMFVRVLAQL